MFNTQFKPVPKVTLGSYRQMQDLQHLHRKRSMRLLTTGFAAGTIPGAVVTLMYASPALSALAMLAMVQALIFTAMRLWMARDLVRQAYRYLTEGRDG